MTFPCARKLGNICCGHKMFLNKIRNILCPGHKICVRNKYCARGQTGKPLCRQQCDRNNVSSFASTFRLRKLGNICCGHKIFLNKIRNIFCVPDTNCMSATNVARAGKRGNICVGNNGRLPFDQKFRSEFPEISLGKWYSLFPVWKTIIVRLEYFNDL